MAYKHLNQENLVQLLQLLNTEFGTKVDKIEGMGLSANDFTSELKAKLEGIEEGANKYVHAAHTAQALGLWKVQVDAEGHVIAATAIAKEDITGLGIPGQDTTYVVATQEADGLMAAADKAKLDGIADGANKYIHATHTEYASGFYKITVDGEGHVTAAAAVVKSDLATLLGEATLTEAGLMSAADKTKLEGIAAGAQVNVIEEIQVNGTKIDPNGKAVNISVPTGTLAGKNEVSESELEATLKAKIDAAAAAQHTHDNKALLDTYTQTEADLADAVAKKHAHTFNEAELNKIAEGDKAKWDKAVEDLTGEIARAKAEEAKNAQAAAAAATAAGAAQTTADEAKAAAAANATAITTGDAATLKSAQEYADAAVKAQIASAYKASGTIQYEQLPEPTAEVLGNVYNISNDFTTDADFVEGAGKAYKAGVNVAIVEIEGAYKYDVMAMSFDGFVQESDIEEFTAEEITALWNSVFTA